MKITCQACAAKYTIADDKVLGKIVKIRCKKCGATIVVNGNDPTASAAPASQSGQAFDYAAQPSGEPWTVNVADGDQRSMTDGEIVAAYHSGLVTDETFCWRDGMSDWLPLREVPDLYDVCTATRAGAPVESPDEGVTKVHEARAIAVAARAAAAPTYTAPAAGNGGAMAAAPAARRVAGRAAAADLFSGAAQAGGEEDVMTSAPTSGPSGMPRAHEADGALTGARNENSVLFSLNALTSKGPGGPRAQLPASSEASGLIDIRQLGAQMGMGDDKRQRRLDDIMNLAGGGAFSPSLGAPVLAPPPIEEYAPPADASGAVGAQAVPSKSRGLILLAIGGGILVIAGAIGAAVTFMGKSETADTSPAAASPTASSASAQPVASVLNAPTPTTTETATAAAPPSAPADTSSAATAAGTSSSASVANAAKTAPTTTSSPTTTAAATATATHAAPTAAATTTAAGADQPFNMGEAKARLAAIAGSVQGCKRGDVSGSGRVVVTFAPSGNVASAVVSGVGFEGTPTGACVASRFRGAHVPAFSGSPFSVSKSFTIN